MSRFVAWLTKRLRSLPMAVRLFLLTFSSGVAIIYCYFLYDQRHTADQLRDMERKTLHSLTPLLANTVENAMLRGTRDHIDTIFHSFGEGPVLKYVELLDAQGKIVRTADFRNAASPGRDDPSPPEPEHWLSIRLPLKNNPSCHRCHDSHQAVLGYIHLAAPLTQTAAAIHATSQRRLLTLLVGLLLLGGICLVFVQQLLHAPFQRIIRSMDAVSRGRLETRIRDDLPAEFGTISRDFNSMVEVLEKDRKEILALHRRQVGHMDRLASLGELTAHLAHEIRNPLTGISSAIQVLMRDYPEEDSRHKVFEKILGQLSRMNKTMDNFLQYARVPEGGSRSMKISLPLQRALFLIEPRQKSQKVALSVNLPPDLPEVHANPEQLEQVFLNLLLNSLHAMPEGGAISITGRRDGEDGIQLEIDDTGSGIRPEDLEKVFKPFFTTKKDGSGLGLPIVKQIIDSHAGRLWIESSPGKGTSVFLRLPAAGSGEPERPLF